MEQTILSIQRTQKHHRPLPDTLYFDGKCALCSREIKTLARLKTPSLELVDVHSMDVAEFVDTSKADMLELLYLKTSDGDWVVGLDATVKAWSHTKLGWLLKPLRWPGIRLVADLIYRKWAERRYCKLYK